MPLSGLLGSAAVFLVIAWIICLRYQARHPEWWPPWDSDLPQQSRMLNVFVPVGGVFLFVLWMTPTFQTMMHKAKQHRMHHRHNATGTKSVELKFYAVGADA